MSEPFIIKMGDNLEDKVCPYYHSKCRQGKTVDNEKCFNDYDKCNEYLRLCDRDLAIKELKEKYGGK